MSFVAHKTPKRREWKGLESCAEIDQIIASGECATLTEVAKFVYGINPKALHMARLRYLKRSHVPRSRMTTHLRDRIARAHSSGGLTTSEIARAFMLPRTSVYRIVARLGGDDA